MAFEAALRLLNPVDYLQLLHIKDNNIDVENSPNLEPFTPEAVKKTFEKALEDRGLPTSDPRYLY